MEQAVTTVDTAAGTRQWVEDGPTVEGMVAGGFWMVVDREPGQEAPARARRRAVVRVEDEEVTAGVEHPVGPAGDAGGDEPVRVG